MKVIICGAGQVGWQIARHLSGEMNDVTVVDNNADRVVHRLDHPGVDRAVLHLSHAESSVEEEAFFGIPHTYSLPTVLIPQLGRGLDRTVYGLEG